MVIPTPTAELLMAMMVGFRQLWIARDTVPPLGKGLVIAGEFAKVGKRRRSYLFIFPFLLAVRSESGKVNRKENVCSTIGINIKQEGNKRGRKLVPIPMLP